VNSLEEIIIESDQRKQPQRITFANIFRATNRSERGEVKLKNENRKSMKKENDFTRRYCVVPLWWSPPLCRDSTPTKGPLNASGLLDELGVTLPLDASTCHAYVAPDRTESRSMTSAPMGEECTVTSRASVTTLHSAAQSSLPIDSSCPDSRVGSSVHMTSPESRSRPVSFRPAPRNPLSLGCTRGPVEGRLSRTLDPPPRSDTLRAK
jgi:hypothetical protein